MKQINGGEGEGRSRRVRSQGLTARTGFKPFATSSNPPEAVVRRAWLQDDGVTATAKSPGHARQPLRQMIDEYGSLSAKKHVGLLDAVSLYPVPTPDLSETSYRASSSARCLRQIRAASNYWAVMRLSSNEDRLLSALLPSLQRPSPWLINAASRDR